MRILYAAVADRVKAYQTGHQQTNHWADIGYHFVIDREGRIWEGRELSWKGAHAGNKQANENNVGVALIGNFENSDPSAAQRNSAEELITWLSLEYGISSSKIYGHGEIEKLYGIKGTCCPGRRFGADARRHQARGRPRAAERRSGGERLTARQSQEAYWHKRVVRWNGGESYAECRGARL